MAAAEAGRQWGPLASGDAAEMLAENLMEEFEMKEDEPWYDHQDLQQGEDEVAGGRERGWGRAAGARQGKLLCSWPGTQVPGGAALS